MVILTSLVQFPRTILRQQMLAGIMKMPFFATTALVTLLIVQVNLSLQQVNSIPRNKHQQLTTQTVE